MDGGYIKIFRKMTDWEWYQDTNTMRLFFHCLLMANYEEKKWKGTAIPVGSFITSENKLGEELHLSRQQIRRAICNLQTTNNITIKTTNKYTAVTVLNYALYQGLEDDETTNSANIDIDETQPSNNHNGRNKEVSKEKVVFNNTTKKKKSSSSKYGTIEDVFGEYCMGDDGLLQALLGFRDYRLKRSPLTPYAAHLICLELDKLAKTTQEKIEIVKQSIRRGWTDVFALKDFGLNGKGNASNKSFDETIDERLKQAEAYMKGETS